MTENGCVCGVTLNLRPKSEKENWVCWLSLPEMCGATFDEDEDDEITFVRGVNLERLAIKAFIDLANPKLIMRFQDSLVTSAPGPVKGNSTKSNIIKVVGGGCSVCVEWGS